MFLEIEIEIQKQIDIADIDTFVDLTEKFFSEKGYDAFVIVRMEENGIR